MSRLDENVKSRKKIKIRKRRRQPIIIALILLLNLLVFSSIYIYFKRYSPTKKEADLSSYFGVEGDEVLIYLNFEKQLDYDENLALTGIYEGNSVFIPFRWTITNINRRFYYDLDTESLFYTRDSDTLKFNKDTLLANNEKAIIDKNGHVYINLDLIKELSDINVDKFVDFDYKRVFIEKNHAPMKYLRLKKSEWMRVKGGVKSPVLTDIAKGDDIVLLQKMDKWSKVYSPNGYIGYIRNKRIESEDTREYKSDFKEEEFQHILRNKEKVILGFMQTMNISANRSFEKLTKGNDVMNTIAPTWFVLSDSMGNVRDISSKDMVKAAHAKGYTVWPTVNNFDIKDVSTGEFLRSSESRKRLIDSLIKSMEKNNFDGINIDFELIKKSEGRDYVQFIRELSVELGKLGKQLSVDIYVPYEYNSHYDLEELSKFADYIIVMCYDEHYTPKDPGSVSSIGYLARGVRESSGKIDPERLIVAVPFYTRVWKDKDGEKSMDTISIKKAKEWVKETGIELKWDDNVAQYYGKIKSSDGVVKTIWMEDERSMKAKIKYIEHAGIAGVAAWKLSQEPADFWEILDLNKKVSKE